MHTDYVRPTECIQPLVRPANESPGSREHILPEPCPQHSFNEQAIISAPRIYDHLPISVSLMGFSNFAYSAFAAALKCSIRTA